MSKFSTTQKKKPIQSFETEQVKKQDIRKTLEQKEAFTIQ